MEAMFTGHGNLSYDSTKNRIIWLSLSFQAGTINVGGFLAAQRFVTHTTGFATFFGESVARGNFIAGLGLLSVPLFFLLGSMLAGYLVDRRIILNQKPLYSLSFFLMIFFMLLTTWIGVSDGFGRFGVELRLKENYFFLALLCLTSGLQNGLVTTAFGATIRTTHLTGVTTDLGLGLIRIFFNATGSHPRTREVKANWMRFSIITAFVLGSLFSGIIFLKTEFWGFLIPTGISTGLWLLSLYHGPERAQRWLHLFHHKKTKKGAPIR